MPRPIALANGVFHLNIRVPADLAPKARGTKVTLPVGGKSIVVTASDKVIASLRTKDPAVAKERFATAEAALGRHWRSLREAPRPLTHKQVMAIAGVFYREQVSHRERDHALTPEAIEHERREFALDVEAWGIEERDGEFVEVPEDDARALALLARPNGEALLAYRGRGDIDWRMVTISYVEALERLFGQGVDRLSQRLGVRVGPESRVLLLRAVGEAYRQVEAKMLRNLAGDYSPDPAAGRFPEFERVPPTADDPPKARELETVGDLFDRWKGKQAGKVAQSTIRRYGPSVASLDRFAQGRAWRSLAAADVFAWATHRSEDEGVSAATVNRNDLVAVASILGWATMANGRRVSADNPAFGVRIEPPKRVVTRERHFRADEIGGILRLARSVGTSATHPRASASRRWAPWLCAYSGARVQEVLWLTKADVRVEAGVNVMSLRTTKDGHARTVPLHDALIDEGFLDFVASAPDGWLFVGDRAGKPGATRTIQEMRAAELAAWVQAKLKLEEGVSPNHAWRHTWITYAEGVGIAKRLSNRITGHNMDDVSGRYVGQPITLLAAEMAKFPRYLV